MSILEREKGAMQQLFHFKKGTHRNLHRVKKVSGKAATLDGEFPELALLVRLLEDVFFHCTLTNKTVDVDVSRLSNAMATVLCLRDDKTMP